MGHPEVKLEQTLPQQGTPGIVRRQMCMTALATARSRNTKGETAQLLFPAVAMQCNTEGVLRVGPHKDNKQNQKLSLEPFRNVRSCNWVLDHVA